MASNTENLDLLMKNPSTDGADTFNVQTMLNENWQKIDNNAGAVAKTLSGILKPSTAQTLGLPGTAVPDDMFNVLAHAGDLHVWKKTTKNAADIPAGYIITDKTGVGSVISNSARITVSYSDAVDVDDQGNVSLRAPITTETYSVPGLNQLGATNPTYISGKFFTATTYNGVMYRKPSVSWSFGNGDDGTYFFGGFVVKGYAKVLAGTTVTYPVSANRNAYPDVKPAGYTLGSVVNGAFNLVSADHMGSSVTFYRVDDISVAPDGSMTRIAVSPNPYTTVKGYDALPSEFKGKFIQVLEVQAQYAGSPFNDGRIYYIPEDAVFSTNSVDRYQPINSYPMDDTYQYLGQLGGSFRCAVVRYIGTGVYGAANPITITAPFRINAMIMLYSGAYYTDQSNLMVNAADLNTEYTNYAAFYRNGSYSSQSYGSSTFGKISTDGRSYSWYNTEIANDYVFNAKGVKYSILVIG